MTWQNFYFYFYFWIQNFYFCIFILVFTFQSFTFDTFGMLSHFSAFGLLEILRSATGKLFLFTFRTRKQNWKILFLSQMLFENITQIFNFCTKNWHQQNHEDLGTNWYIGIFFWKAPMLHYHCTKFPVSRISVSRDLSWGTQIGPSSHTLTLIVLKMLRRCLHLKSTALLVFFLDIDVYFPYTDIFYYRLCLFLCRMSVWIGLCCGY